MDAVEGATCDGCRHLDPVGNECMVLLGQLHCELCREIWHPAAMKNKKPEARFALECPQCGQRPPPGTEPSRLNERRQRPRCCPGFEAPQQREEPQKNAKRAKKTRQKQQQPLLF